MSNLILNTECSLRRTLCGGQAFRWTETHVPGIFFGIAGKNAACIKETDGGIEIEDYSGAGRDFWEEYFSAGVDYSSILKNISSDKTLSGAVKNSGVIRILKQEPFETLISFIISQNNNIPRIKGIISRLCGNFGEHIFTDSQGIRHFSFPAAQRLAEISAEDLAPLRAGFRVRYILDASRRISSGDINFSLSNEGRFPISNDEARRELMKIVGVGEKVADCVLLFGFGRKNVFPRDVWIKRIEAEHYPDGLPECFDGFRGIAQQYLFENFRG